MLSFQVFLPFFLSNEINIDNSRPHLLSRLLLRSYFLQFKEFELYWGAVFFFKICSHIFMIFEVKLE